MTKLILSAILKFILGLVLFCSLLFLPAGTFCYSGGWLLVAILFVPMFVAGMVMIFKNPQLLEKRLNAKEEQVEQRVVVLCSGVMFVLGLAVAGFSHRFGWCTFPRFFTIVGVVVFIFAYVMYFIVITENEFLSRTVEIQENHKVIDKGLYAVVRHPMYTATILLFVAMPVILGSVYSFFIFLIYPAIIIKRIKYEEKFLVENLIGYKEYIGKVKYRLIPFIW